MTIHTKPTLFYISDALCGWCFAMGPQIEKLQAAYADKFHFEVLSGGMILGDRVGPIGNMANYIRQAMPRLNEITGVQMGEAYFTEVLDKGTYISNSEPPAIALSIFKELHPNKQVKYAKAIQDLQFKEGKDFNEVETYLPLAAEAGLSEEQFRERFAEEKYQRQAMGEFAQVQDWGIQGFPSMVAQNGDKLYLVTRGYAKFEDLTPALEQVLAQ
ncbi:DsbA family protein [Rufibacter hautae]|uniref:Thioredoxin domain-containing protein n=1 Tax=Rufibacter hautae TaxID=2595005 RepID=A0A5B6TJR3_9BACT|nr:DsbA family protein [Rufibacter hautae]KAA3440216.1 thioredoxin domain-containing protein [Rufibacter hautae]